MLTFLYNIQFVYRHYPFSTLSTMSDFQSTSNAIPYLRSATPNGIRSNVNMVPLSFECPLPMALTHLYTVHLIQSTTIRRPLPWPQLATAASPAQSMWKYVGKCVENMWKYVEIFFSDSQTIRPPGPYTDSHVSCGADLMAGNKESSGKRF